MLAAHMFLGGVSTQIGWLLFGFGSVFFWLFAWHADLTGWRFRESVIGRVPGTAVDCRETHYHIGGSDDTVGTPVYENRYRYEVDGKPLTGSSYDTGRCLAGSSVTVEYLLERPAYSRIEGMRRERLSPWALLAALLPGAGLVLVGAGLRAGLLRLRLLRDGVPVSGEVTARTPTRSSTMGRADYRMTVAFTACDGSKRSVTVKTNRPEDLESTDGAMVLHDPYNPARALPVGSMPGPISLDESGSFTAGSSRSFLTLPVLSALCNAWFIWRNLMAR